jgi:hypothetical protein
VVGLLRRGTLRDTRAPDHIKSPTQAATAEANSGRPRAAAVSRIAGALLVVGFLALLAVVGVGMLLNARAERSLDAVLASRNLSAVADGLRAALQVPGVCQVSFTFRRRAASA